jgi:Transmembrane amino acid transporter protein
LTLSLAALLLVASMKSPTSLHIQRKRPHAGSLSTSNTEIQPFGLGELNDDTNRLQQWPERLWSFARSKFVSPYASSNSADGENGGAGYGKQEYGEETSEGAQIARFSSLRGTREEDTPSLNSFGSRASFERSPLSQELVPSIEDHMDQAAVGDAHAQRRKVALPTRVDSIDTSLGKRKTTLSMATPPRESYVLMPASIFNLVNNVAGAGILSLSAGKAAGTGWVPALFICSILGIVSAHTFLIIGYACELTSQTDFKGLWQHTLGPSTSYAVDLMISLMCLGCCIIYCGILGDVAVSALAGFSGFPLVSNHRSLVIISIAGTLLLPLSLARNLSALTFTSSLGFGAVAYTVLFIVYRCLDGSYNPENGRFVGAGLLAGTPTFEKSTLWNIDYSSLILCSNLGK